MQTPADGAERLLARPQDAAAGVEHDEAGRQRVGEQRRLALQDGARQAAGRSGGYVGERADHASDRVAVGMALGPRMVDDAAQLATLAP